jgi:hypothetical protein
MAHNGLLATRFEINGRMPTANEPATAPLGEPPTPGKRSRRVFTSGQCSPPISRLGGAFAAERRDPSIVAEIGGSP